MPATSQQRRLGSRASSHQAGLCRTLRSSHGGCCVPRARPIARSGAISPCLKPAQIVARRAPPTAGTLAGGASRLSFCLATPRGHHRREVGGRQRADLVGHPHPPTRPHPAHIRSASLARRRVPANDVFGRRMASTSISSWGPRGRGRAGPRWRALDTPRRHDGVVRFYGQRSAVVARTIEDPEPDARLSRPRRSSWPVP
jgi:hypothetical protein